MGQCPDCGATVHEHYRFCRQCGTALATGPDGTHTDQQGQHGSPAASAGSSERGRRGNTREGDQAQPGGTGQPSEPERGPEPSGLSRRKLLLSGGVGLVVLGGGVLAKETLLGPDCSGATGTVRCFFHALNNGNTERAKELTHGDKQDQFDSMVQGNFASFIDSAVEMYGEEELERSEGDPSVSSSVNELSLESGGGEGDQATVVADLSYEIPMAGQDGTYTATVDLRREDDEWLVWAIDYEFDMFSGMGG